MIKYRWATLGCGVIANQLAQALQAQGSNLYSVANRTHDKAVAFAEKYGIEKVYEDIDEVFTDDNGNPFTSCKASVTFFPYSSLKEITIILFTSAESETIESKSKNKSSLDTIPSDGTLAKEYSP